MVFLKAQQGLGWRRCCLVPLAGGPRGLRRPKCWWLPRLAGGGCGPSRTRLIASCQAVAEAPGTARRWCLQVQRQTRLGAWQLGSHSPRSWWLWQARRHTGTGRRRLEGTGHRLGCLVYTQGRVRTVTGQGWQVSPRWAARWLVGRCSGESACGPSRVSGAVGRKERNDGRVGEAKGMVGKETRALPIYNPISAACQVYSDIRALAQAVPLLHTPPNTCSQCPPPQPRPTPYLPPIHTEQYLNLRPLFKLGISRL